MAATVIAITKGRYSEEVTGTFDGADVWGTGALNLPKGTTAQRTSSPETGDMRYNTTTNEFEGYSGASPAWGGLGGGGATGASSNAVFWENDQNVTGNYTITNGKNAGTFGPVTVDAGVTVTVALVKHGQLYKLCQ